ncbi:HlyD family efflux transporter periplasmic adaptor subunit [Verrucomicrobia bacterium]|nr:HlyD family efflux transporter periplasmic adaptor subunit [bacterium]MDC0263640.1 HlyD family efflux transporter periplasmic adaptor subunit [Verrucomicrobiota bacterium]
MSAGAILAIVFIYSLVPSTSSGDEATFTAIRGTMSIDVLEGGTIEATQAQIIKSKVEGRDGTTILKIIDEGYQVTEEDVKNELILVELDSSAIVERIKSQETEVQGALANLMEYVKQREIRESANLSSIKDASVKAKFALMDFQKYLGESAAQKILDDIGISADSIEEEAGERSAAGASLFASSLLDVSNGNTINGGGDEVLMDGLSDPDPLLDQWGGANEQDLLPEIREYDVDFGKFAQEGNEKLLGDGDARQELRKLKDAVLIAEAEFALKKKTYEGAVRLADKGFITPNELQNKKIDFDKSQNSLASTKATLKLFQTYNIQKEAEQFLLNYEQALMRLSRAKKDAIAEMADSVGDLNRAERYYRWEKKQLNDLREQYIACTIKAERPGLVVYGDGSDRWDPDEIIREGAKVRERQAIITIPDMRHMAVKVRIHESQVKRVRKGMPVKISVDAEPDKALTGEVDNVGVLPDSENRRFNPDQKVYKTSIKIAGVHDWLKPGMAAEGRIIIRIIPDIVMIPVQAVFNHKNVTFCCIKSGSNIETRVIQIDDYNNRFAAIKSGVEEGEVVLLQKPEELDLTRIEALPPADKAKAQSTES